jgi:hypothetical protein
MPKKIVRLTESDIEKIVRRVIKEQDNVEDALSRGFKQDPHPDRFKNGIVKNEDELNDFINWYSSEGDALKILNSSGLGFKDMTSSELGDPRAKSDLHTLMGLIKNDLSTLSMYPSKYINNARDVESKIKVDNKITEKYSNYPEVLFKIYQQQLKSIGK